MSVTELELATAAIEKTKYGFALANIVLDEKPFSFDGHNYLIDMYLDNHPYIVIEKSAQMGASVYAMVQAFFVCDKLRGTTIYFFPTDTDVRDFSKTRVAPILRESPYLSKITSDQDSQGLRQVGDKFLYFRGMKSSIAMKCHDDQTEVLTLDGWKLFRDASTSDDFATRSPDGRFMWQRASEVYAYDYVGSMCNFKQNGLDAVVTPHHRMLVKNAQVGPEQFVFAEDVKLGHILPRTSTWKGEVPSFCRKTGRREDGNTYAIDIGELSVDLRDFCAFLGFYLAEGCTEAKSNRVTLTQVKPDTVNLMKQMLKRFGGEWTKSGHNYRYANADLSVMLRDLGDKYSKHIPTWVKNLPPRFLEALWTWAVLGDGHTQNGGTRYGTVSKRLADDYMEVLAKIGKHGSITIQKPPKAMPKIRGRVITSRVPFYNVFERESVVTVLPKPELKPYKGKVYCATVPNGTLLTRRNGQSLWSGNSIPADCLIFDELDEVSEASESLADQRLNHSALKWRLKLSTPTHEGFGIDRDFQKSDKRYWNLICKKCETRNILEFQFPDCIRRVDETTAELICRKCSSVLDTQYGIWVAENPKVQKIRGYHITGLYSSFLSLAELHDEFLSGKRRDEFFRSKLGLPYSAADQRLTPSAVNACRGEYEAHVASHCYMGVDQKGDQLHLTIRHQEKFAKSQVVFVGIVNDFQSLDDYMRRYDVNLCVIDGTPNQHSARDFAARFPGRVFLCYYNENQKGDYSWSEPKPGDIKDDWTVSVNRTEALDAMVEEITRREVELPKNIPEEYVSQLCSIARTNEIDEKDGSIMRTYWKRLGADHWAHSSSYALVAQSRYGVNTGAITLKAKSFSRVRYARQFEMGSRF